jgi:hypothetical protein
VARGLVLLALVIRMQPSQPHGRDAGWWEGIMAQDDEVGNVVGAGEDLDGVGAGRDVEEARAAGGGAVQEIEVCVAGAGFQQLVAGEREEGADPAAGEGLAAAGHLALERLVLGNDDEVEAGDGLMNVPGEDGEQLGLALEMRADIEGVGLLRDVAAVGAEIEEREVGAGAVGEELVRVEREAMDRGRTHGGNVARIVPIFRYR